VKLTALQTTDDRPPPHPERQQLLPAHHGVLPLRQLRNPSVKRMNARVGS
jgi:hypothetical protein